MSIPLIDERIRYVGVSYLRSLNATTLAALTDVVVVQVDEQPAGVIIPYAIYLEIQKALWPSSLVPSMDEVPSVSALAQEEDARAADLWSPVSGLNHCPGCGAVANPSIGPSEPSLCPKCRESQSDTPEPNGGADANSDMQHSMESYSEPTSSETPSTLERLKKTVAEGDVKLTVIPFEDTPRGAKFSRVDDSKPPVIDDIDEYQSSPPGVPFIVDERSSPLTDLEIRNVKVNGEDRGPQVPLCSHCNNPSDKALCPACFMSGHRDGNCLKCAEGAK